MSRTIKPQAFKEHVDKEKNILILDVRRDADYQADREMIPGAIKRNPEQVEQWAGEIPKDRDVVVYCTTQYPGLREVGDRSLHCHRTRTASSRLAYLFPTST